MLSYRYGALLFQSLRQANRNLRFIMSKLCGEWFPTQALALVSRATGSHFQGGTLDVVLVKKAGVLGLNMVNPSGIVGKESRQCEGIATFSTCLRFECGIWCCLSLVSISQLV